ncbi:hypothetical protein BsWGS_20459 [Bradybaena similaris]
MRFNDSNNTTASLPDYNDDTIVSYQVLGIVQIVNNIILNGAVCLVGMVVNIINMIIFVQQGLDNTVNIAMFAISLSEWCSLVTLEWLNINSNKFMHKADVPFEPADVGFLFGSWPHACFVQITIWMTIYVTGERFVCIAFPLKVKQIVTPFRTKIVVTCIYLLMFVNFSPMYVLFYLGDTLCPGRNETRVGLIFRVSIPWRLGEQVHVVALVIRFAGFITLIILTCVLVITVKKKSDWRKRSTMDGEKSKKITARDAKTMKMVSLIAGTLIICTAADYIFAVVKYIMPEYNRGVKNEHIMYISMSFTYLSEAISSTVNIIFFYKMSTKFRHQFHELFVKCRCSCQRG